MFRTHPQDTCAARKLRLLTTSLAVVLGVAFMAGTLVLTDTIGTTFDDLLRQRQRRHRRRTSAAKSPSTATGSATSGRASTRRWSTPIAAGRRRRRGRRAHPGLRPARRQGRQADRRPRHGRTDVRCRTGSTSDELNPFDLAAGRAPHARRRGRDRQGARPTPPASPSVTRSRCSRRPAPQQFTIVGIAKFGDGRQPGRRRRSRCSRRPPRSACSTEPGKFDAIPVVAEPGVCQQQLVDRIAKPSLPAGTEVLTGAQITEETRQTMQGRPGLLQHLPAGRSPASPCSSARSSSTTPSRSSSPSARREMALLRAIGASRRQVLGSVLVEAVVVGLIASVARSRRRRRRRRRPARRCSTAIGIDIPAGGVVLASRDGDRLARRRPSVSPSPRRCFPARRGREGAADRGDARRRPRHVGRSRKRGRHRLDHHRARCGRDGCRPVRWRRSSPLVGLGALARVRRCRRARSGDRPPDQPGARLAARPACGA